MYCAKCGARIADGALKCDRCGTPARIRSSSASEQRRDSAFGYAPRDLNDLNVSGGKSKEDGVRDPVYFEKPGENVDVESIIRIAHGEEPVHSGTDPEKDDNRQEKALEKRNSDRGMSVGPSLVLGGMLRRITEKYRELEETREERRMARHMERAARHYEMLGEAATPILRRTVSEKAETSVKSDVKPDISEKKTKAVSEGQTGSNRAIEDQVARERAEKVRTQQAKQSQRGAADSKAAAGREALAKQERQAREEAERRAAAEKAEAESKAVAEREALAKQEKQAREEAERRAAAEKAEAESKAAAEREALAKQERQAREETERRAEAEKAEAESKAAAEREALAKQEKQAREEAERRAEAEKAVAESKAAAEREAAVKQEQQAREEAERRAEAEKAAAESKAAAEREALAKQEKQVREEAERRAAAEKAAAESRAAAGREVHANRKESERVNSAFTEKVLSEEEKRIQEARRIRRYYEEESDQIDLFLGKFGLTKEAGVKIATLFLVAILSVIYVAGRGKTSPTDGSPRAGEGMTGEQFSVSPGDGNTGEDSLFDDRDLPTGGGDFRNQQSEYGTEAQQEGPDTQEPSGSETE